MAKIYFACPNGETFTLDTRSPNLVLHPDGTKVMHRGPLGKTCNNCMHCKTVYIPVADAASLSPEVVSAIPMAEPEAT